jgi:hypothetical protein
MPPIRKGHRCLIDYGKHRDRRPSSAPWCTPRLGCGRSNRLRPPIWQSARKSEEHQGLLLQGSQRCQSGFGLDDFYLPCCGLLSLPTIPDSGRSVVKLKADDGGQSKCVIGIRGWRAFVTEILRIRIGVPNHLIEQSPIDGSPILVHPDLRKFTEIDCSHAAVQTLMKVHCCSVLGRWRQRKADEKNLSRRWLRDARPLLRR